MIIAPQSPGGADMLEVMRAFGETGVRMSVIPALLQVVGSAVSFDDVHGVSVLGVRSFRLSRSSRLVKRAFDFVSAAFGLILAAPLMAVIAAAIKLTSRGPIFFRRERVGREGRRFRMLKFRSMVHDAEARKGELHRRNQAAEGSSRSRMTRGSHGSGAWRARPTSTNCPSC